ncbi:HalOD1 output domain-containing protein [Haloferax larsenii]|nr:HalOD1 output domain-containing protein [Haloferax larsenii]
MGGYTISTLTTHRRDETEQTRVWYDCDRSETISEAILFAAAEHRDCDPTELPPLSEYVDIDALNVLFGEDSPMSPALSRGTLEFDYGDLVVDVDTVGTVEIRDAE